MYTKGHYVLIFHTLLLSKKFNIHIFKGKFLIHTFSSHVRLYAD